MEIGISFNQVLLTVYQSIIPALSCSRQIHSATLLAWPASAGSRRPISPSMRPVQFAPPEDRDTFSHFLRLLIEDRHPAMAVRNLGAAHLLQMAQYEIVVCVLGMNGWFLV
jgi:hypothetical protein